MKFSSVSLGSLFYVLVLFYLCCKTSCRRLVVEATDSNYSKNYLHSNAYEGDEDLGETSNGRSERLLPFFINMAQSPCMGTMNQAGVCTKAAFCTARGGANIGPCANGFGTCCRIVLPCAATPQMVDTSGTILTQASGAAAMANQVCTYSIPRAAGICQVRLDFTAFTIDDFDAGTGNCQTDTLTIDGNSNVVPDNLCGDLTNQHMYLDYGAGVGGTININVNLVANTAQTWNILVTFINCNSNDRAPPGCLQFFTNARDTVRSFDYRPFSPNGPEAHQLNNENYAVCIRAVAGARTIAWRTCGGPNDFWISTPQAGDAGGVSGGNNDPVIITGNECTRDYVMINGAGRFCGNRFPMQVISRARPFMLQVTFDGQEQPVQQPPPAVPCGDDTMNQPACNAGSTVGLAGSDYGNTGFCLVYSQSVF